MKRKIFFYSLIIILVLPIFFLIIFLSYQKYVLEPRIPSYHDDVITLNASLYCNTILDCTLDSTYFEDEGPCCLHTCSPEAVNLNERQRREKWRDENCDDLSNCPLEDCELLKDPEPNCNDYECEIIWRKK